MTRAWADTTLADDLGVADARLLAHLATIVRNTLRPKTAKPGEATFTLTTGPVPNSNRPPTSSPRLL